MRLAVVIPTIGRPELARCLASVVPQLGPDDLVYVMFDGEYRHMVEVCGPVLREHNADWHRVWYYASPDGVTLGQFGHPQRNRALDLLPHRIDYVWSLDDDDVATPNALAWIRAAVGADALDYGRPRWYAFQMRFGPEHPAAGITCWRERRVHLGDIGTPCIVMPRKARARWGDMSIDPRLPHGPSMGVGYYGDYELAVRLQAEFGEPFWCEHVVAEIRPGAIASPDAG